MHGILEEGRLGLFILSSVQVSCDFPVDEKHLIYGFDYKAFAGRLYSS